MAEGPRPSLLAGYNPAFGLLAALLLGIALDWAAPLPGTPWPLAPRLALGLPPLALAGALGLWGMFRLWRAGTPIEPLRDPKALVATGPYRFSRNPLYVAQLLLLSGLGLAAFPWLLALGVVQALLLHLVVIPGEERRLDTAFGEAYQDYRRRVRRWL